MIDALLRFTSEAAGQAALTRFTDAAKARWDLSAVIPDVKVWRPSQDTTGAPVDGVAPVVHAYLSGFYVLVSADRASLPDAVLALSQVQFAFDREALAARTKGSILKSTVSAALLRDVRFEPVFMGADIPWGSLDQYV